MEFLVFHKYLLRMSFIDLFLGLMLILQPYHKYLISVFKQFEGMGYSAHELFRQCSGQPGEEIWKAEEAIICGQLPWRAAALMNSVFQIFRTNFLIVSVNIKVPFLIHTKQILQGLQRSTATAAFSPRQQDLQPGTAQHSGPHSVAWCPSLLALLILWCMKALSALPLSRNPGIWSIHLPGSAA